jgi:hypothetical protein
MKRVIFCAFLCMLLIGTVSALNLTPSKIPAATLKVTAAPTLQYIVKPDIQVSFSPSTTPTQIPFGSLEVYSNPSEAEVVIFDNQMEVLGNYSTPLYLPIVPVGTFNIAITYPGYRYYIGTITIQNGQTTVVSETLVPLSSPTSQMTVNPTPATQTDSIPTNTPPIIQQNQVQPTSSRSAGSPSDSTGSLSITTTPAGAVVSVDNEVKGVSPAMISGIVPGTHALKISKAGYQDFSTTITIEAGKVLEYSTGLTEAVSGATTTTATSAANTPANSLGFPVFAAIIALFGLVVVRKRSR